MLTESEAKVLLRPYKTELNQIIRSAWNKTSQLERVAPFHFARTRANVMFDLMIQEANRKFLPLSGSVKNIVHPNTQWFCVDQKLVFRLKKSDEFGHTANYPTQTAIDFTDPQKDFSAIPKLRRVEIAYILNETETEIIDIRVIAPSFKSVEWMFSIMDEAEVIQLPAKSKSEEKKPVRAKVKFKNTDKDQVEVKANEERKLERKL